MGMNADVQKRGKQLPKLIIDFNIDDNLEIRNGVQQEE
jgi:hypothetical protein